MAFLLLGNKIGGINDITANHQCAFKTGYGCLLYTSLVHFSAKAPSGILESIVAIFIYNFIIYNLRLASTTSAVSYTHLDVYKRQPL